MPDNYGVTPLHVAAAIDYSEMVDFFLDCDGKTYIWTSGNNIVTMCTWLVEAERDFFPLECHQHHGEDVCMLTQLFH